jgi:peroxiredoxin
MKMPGHSLFTTSLALALLSLSALAANQFDGELAPDFVLRSGDGENVRLSEYRGEVVLVNFWATWCGDCRDQMASLDSLYGLYHEAGLELLSINLDNKAERGQEMSRSLQLRFPVLYDSDRKVSKLYDVDAMPVTLLIDREGVVRYVQQGFRRGAEERYVEQVKALLRE